MSERRPIGTYLGKDPLTGAAIVHIGLLDFTAPVPQMKEWIGKRAIEEMKQEVRVAMSYSNMPSWVLPMPTVRPPAPKLGDKHPDKTCKKCGNKGHIVTALLDPPTLICKLCGKEAP